MTRASARPIAALALYLVAALALTSCAGSPPILPPELRHIVGLPLGSDSVSFAVIGDTGSGNPPQYEVGERLAEAREKFPFDFVIMLGDNLYGLERPVDYERKFELPYAALLEQGVTFHAALGNHDNPNQRFYEKFNMGGKRYYSFTKGNVKFFALDSNYMDEEQLTWLQKELEESKEDWKIAFFHHPIYSSGWFHGSDVALRQRLEPLFVKYGVRVVFSGHEHFYERIKPQLGVYYFIAGGSARLRRGNILNTELTARGFDTDNSFMLVEINGDTLYFETVARSGELVEAGNIARGDTAPPPPRWSRPDRRSPDRSWTRARSPPPRRTSLRRTSLRPAPSRVRKNAGPSRTPRYGPLARRESAAIAALRRAFATQRAGQRSVSGDGRVFPHPARPAAPAP